MGRKSEIHWSAPASTLGELRRCTAHMSDDTPIVHDPSDTDVFVVSMWDITLGDHISLRPHPQDARAS